MGHSQMLTIRRKKKNVQKHLAGTAKRAKKLRQQGAKTARADAPKKGAS